MLHSSSRSAWLLLLMSACAETTPPGEQQCALCPAPRGFPEMAVPEDNPLSDAKIELGRHLFYDERLSGNGTQACASCHEQSRAFSDGKALPVGSTGQTIVRNSPSLANAGYLPVYTWVNPLLQSLEQQAMVPLFADVIVELGATYHEEEILERLREDERYPELFQSAFPGVKQPIHWDNVIKALASFQRTLVSSDSPYDRFIGGEEDSGFSESARRGLDLFNSERLECYHCHAGFNFTTAVRTSSGESWKASFVNPGLYNVDGEGGYPKDNPGLYEITEDPRDIGRFRVPSLRNVAVTAPYMHDGSLATLDEVIDHYARGGRVLTEGPYVGDGSLNPNKDPLMIGFELSAEERKDVLAFLESLTDEAFLSDPRFANPFEEASAKR